MWPFQGEDIELDLLTVYQVRGDLNRVASLAVVFVIEIISKCSLAICQRSSAVLYRHRPNPLQRILQLDEMGGARELLGSLTLASLGHNTNQPT